VRLRVWGSRREGKGGKEERMVGDGGGGDLYTLCLIYLLLAKSLMLSDPCYSHHFIAYLCAQELKKIILEMAKRGEPIYPIQPIIHSFLASTSAGHRFISCLLHYFRFDFRLFPWASFFLNFRLFFYLPQLCLY
jgi:hypothetical protein